MSDTDLLNRTDFINRLETIILNQKNNQKGYSIAINGEWGCGKSWILSELEEKLKKNKNNFLIFHYNAWENDFYDEPLVAILSIMMEEIEKVYKLEEGIKSVNKKFSKTALVLLKTVTVSIVNNAIKEKSGIDAKELLLDIESIKESKTELKKVIKQLNNSLPLKNAITIIRSQIKEFSKQKTVLFVVDELDRCLPEYEIKVMERLHHICNEIPVIQVIAFDKNRLKNNICNLFAFRDEQSNIAEKYLEKFINTTLSLNNGDSQTGQIEIFNGFDKLFGLYRNAFFSTEFLLEFYNTFLKCFPIRTQKRIIEKTKLVHELTITQAMELEYYSNAILCLELLEVIRLEYFSFDILYKVAMENNSGLYVCERNTFNTNELTTDNLFLNQLKQFTLTNASYIGTGRQDGIILYVQSQNEKQLFLNYFLENLTYTAADGFTYYVNDIKEDKEFLKQFKNILMTIEN